MLPVAFWQAIAFSGVLQASSESLAIGSELTTDERCTSENADAACMVGGTVRIRNQPGLSVQLDGVHHLIGRARLIQKTRHQIHFIDDHFAERDVSKLLHCSDQFCPGAS